MADAALPAASAVLGLDAVAPSVVRGQLLPPGGQQ
jgi:hypothetical protein